MTFRKNLIAFAVISLLGTLGHFIYEWTGENRIIGMFFPVNESIWEHLKLIFFPAAAYFTAEALFTKEKPCNLIPASVIGILCGMLSVVILFYTYKGIVGKSIDFLNIAIYYISVIVLLCKRNKLISQEKFCLQTARLPFLALATLIALAFIFWSFNPPSLGIFIPPAV